MAHGASLPWLCTLVFTLAARSSTASILRSQHRQHDLPPEAADAPLWNCTTLHNVPMETKAPWDMNHLLATNPLCKKSGLKKYMEVFLDKRFQPHYERVYGKDGWVDEAWVNFLAVREKGSYYGRLAEKLITSVHEHSTRPIVVVNFGRIAPPELDPERFPRLVMLHARPVQGVSFNFNKMTAILLAKAKVGISLDADMWMVNPEGDRLFQTARKEITAAYPFPMMPTHYLDRDPANAKWGKGKNFLYFNCPQCPKPTLRWGQAQPSWTHYAFQFVGRWLAAKLESREEHGVPTRHIGEDEDLINVALWTEGAKKAQCAWHLMGTPFVWQNYGHDPQNLGSPYYNDPKRFPKGIPVGFLFSHAEHNFSHFDTAEAHMKLLKKRSLDKKKPPLKSFFHAGHFYNTFDQLKSANADIGCVL